MICWKGWACQSHLVKKLWSDFLTPRWSTTFLRMCFFPRIFTDHLSRYFVPWLDLESNFGENQHDYCAELCTLPPAPTPSNDHTFVACCFMLPLNLPHAMSSGVFSGGFQVHAGFLPEGCTAGFHARRLFAARPKRTNPCIVVASCSMCPKRGLKFI